MASFDYRACNADGHALTGTLVADDLAAVERSLRSTGVWLLEAHERGGSGPAKSGGSPVKRSEMIAFFVQMHLLLQAGINLPQALRRLADDFKGARMGEMLTGLLDQVSTGVPLNQAMRSEPKVFTTQIVAIVRAGEMSGKLPMVFENLAAYYEWLDQLVSDIRQALIYPIMVAGASVMLIVGLFTFVVPKFVDLLKGMQMQVPLLTRVVMAISTMLVHYWPAVIGVAVGVPVLVKLSLRSPRVAASFDRALMRIPVFGSMVAMFALSRFANNLAMLFQSGIPLLQGLEIGRDLVGNRAMAQALDEVRQGVSEGVPMSRCLARYDFFPPTLVTMVATGESSGTLDYSLRCIAAYYNKVIPRRMKIVFAIFNPVMMLVLISVVGCVALAVVLPILQLWQAK